VFWAKKFVTFWLLPVPLCLTLLAIGLVLLCFNRRVRLARGCLIAGTLLLALFSNKVASTWLVRPLEARYPAIPELTQNSPLPADLIACRYVAVLGGGHSDTLGMPALSQLSPSSRARLLEGVRLVRALPDARLIVSGPAIGENPSHAAVLARAAVSLGIDRKQILLIETARDTEEEAAAVQSLTTATRVALVTSAWHLPRATALFRRAGVDVLPCPADFSARVNRDARWSDLTWDTASLERSTWAVRERIGLLWAWLRRKI
jgi:uncharacterized SAM-binding protein YcdF (DUF218 family)